MEVYMRASRGEIKIEEVLQEAGLVFEEEYSFPDLISTSGRPLRFDFAVFDDEHNLDFLIEYQGIQHYSPKSKFGGYTGLRKQQYNDMKKKEYFSFSLHFKETIFPLPSYEIPFP